MAENAPSQVKPDDDATRGIPHHIQETEKLRQMLDRQRVLKATLVCHYATLFPCKANTATGTH